MKKLLSFVLALAMVLALVPMGASADTRSTSFTTFAELKQLVATPWYDWTSAKYVGTEPLVIDEDLTLPQNFDLWGHSATVSIAEGVTVTVEGQIYANQLTVDGTLVNYGYVSADNSLTVNGAMTNHGTLDLYSHTAVTGGDKITHVEHGSVNMNYTDISSLEQFAEALDTACVDSDPRTHYNIYYSGHPDGGSVIELAADLVIPANTTVILDYAVFTLPTSCILTVNGTLSLRYVAVLEVEGTLVNNGRVVITCGWNSLLNVVKGTYEGTGEIQIQKSTDMTDPQTAVPGLDLSLFYVYEEDWGWWLTYENIYGSGDSSSIEFESFAELKEVVANAGEDWVGWVYIGTEPLVITEDLTLPENKQMSCFSAPLVVAEGVTLTSNTSIGTNELTVNGKFVNNGGAYVFNLLTVNGSIENRAQITLEDHSIVVNKENITHIGGWLQWQYSPENMAELTEACTIAASDPSAVYSLWVYQSIVVDSDLAIPENVELGLNDGTLTVSSGSTLTVNGNTWLSSGNITVSSGSTLTTNGDLYLYGPLNVEGMLVNDGYVYVYYTPGGLLNMAGTYAGEGEIQIYSEDEKIDVETAAPGLDVSYFPYVYEEDWGWWLTHKDLVGGGSEESFEVASFGEVQALVAEADEYGYLSIYYTGSEPLTIEEDITIPYNVTLGVDMAEIIVPEGVTLTIDGVVYGNTVTIDGVVINYYQLQAIETLTVNNKLVNNYAVDLRNDAKLVGEENIEYTVLDDGWATLLRWHWFPTNEEELQTALAAAADRADTPNHYDIINLYNETELVLTEDITVPYKVDIYTFGGPVTIAKGATVTLNGWLGMYVPVTVEGELICNNKIAVYNVYGATLQITESGSYTANGELWVVVENESVKPEDAVFGIDVSNATFYPDWNEYCIPPVEGAHTHEWGEGVITTPATCTAEGVLTYTCACGETKTEAIPATGHTEVTDAAKAPTCTETGLTEGKHCEVCGEVLVTQEVVAATGHAWDEGVVTTQPGEYTEGVMTHTCRSCGQTKTEPIPALGHTHSHESTVTMPTCTEQGYTTYTCKCGDTYVADYVDAAGHTEVTDAAKAPTCTETGLTEGKHCSVCNEVLVAQEVVAANGHSFGEWVTVVEPTTTTEGKAERKCACGETETKVLPILYTVPDVETSVSDSEFMEKLEDAADNAYIVAEVIGKTDLPETVFEAISGTDKLLELVSEDVTWQFHGKDIVNESKEIDLSVEIAKAEDSAQEIEEKLSENPGVVMKFAENGQLPGKATIQVKLDEDLKTYLGESDKLCVYYYNEETDELELIAENVEVIDGSYVEFAITHCSYYVLTTEIKTEEEQLPKLGDVNNDGRLNAKDATLILRYSVKKYTDYPDWFEQIADVNDDGRVNAKDATLILRFVVNKADISGWER